MLTWEQLAYSFIGAMITNLIIVWNFDVAQSGTGRPGYGRATPTAPEASRTDAAEIG